MADPFGLEEQVIGALRRITRAIDTHSRLLLKRYGLTAPQLTALRAIGRLEPMTVGAVAREIHLGQATVTGILGRLESHGLIVRSRGSEDRRSVLVELTEAGRELSREAPSPLQERFRRELTGLQEWERTMILSTLQRIAAMMQAEAIEAVPVLVSGEHGAREGGLLHYLEEPVRPNDEGLFGRRAGVAMSESGVSATCEQERRSTLSANGGRVG